MSAGTVLITGLNGFVAPHIAFTFLSSGWNVRGTVRSSSKRDKVLALPLLKKGADEGRLTVVIVPDFLESDWTEALEGVTAVVLAASPFDMTLPTYEKFAYPAIQGTTRSLKAAAKVASIQAVAYVSSTVSIVDYFQPMSSHKSKVYSEKDWVPWTEEDAKKEGFIAPHWYSISKKYGELAARDIREKTGASWPLSTYCPPGIYGPPQHINSEEELAGTPGTDLSTAQLYAFLCSGQDADLPAEYNAQYVDVRDLAAAIYAGITQQSNGRYITAGDQVTSQKIANTARRVRPDLSRFIVKGDPKSSEALPEGAYSLDTSTSKTELGVKYHTLEETIRDTIARFEELGAYKKGN
ncbi:uncharacterized protein IL334_001656 [Kwoniella shivajii]|uniref:NAD-dependent epimerase/dehydratase domain-containing protein n=1 Tax=Kwoniella shivajii TaxID=564305 RepID=A0ABZ1CWQ4_9TREE|nr:hypothetical protein IL334_001656 [Kwoniella shivajii]